MSESGASGFQRCFSVRPRPSRETSVERSSFKTSLLESAQGIVTLEQLSPVFTQQLYCFESMEAKENENWWSFELRAMCQSKRQQKRWFLQNSGPQTLIISVYPVLYFLILEEALFCKTTRFCPPHPYKTHWHMSSRVLNPSITSLKQRLFSPWP